MLSKFFFPPNSLSNYYKKTSYTKRYKPVINWQKLCDLSNIGFLTQCDNYSLPMDLSFLVPIFDNIPATKCTFQELWACY